MSLTSAKQGLTLPSHLSYLDGLRGIAAFYVMVYHALSYVSFDNKHESSAVYSELFFLMKQGHFAVVAFIVLSGYCLMFPLVRKPPVINAAYIQGFIKRRARRILPPYYAALAMCFIIFAAAVFLKLKRTEDVFAPWDWISHLLLIHNLDPSTIRGISTPLWTVAAEWQMYFIFIFLLLPVQVLVGRMGLIIFTSTIGLLLSALPVLRATCPWFLCSFALGMITASVNYSQNSIRTGHFFSVAVIFGILSYLVIKIAPELVLRQDGREISFYSWIPDLLFSTCFASLIGGCGESLRSNTFTIVAKILSWKPFLLMGSFSYSLYLVHSPLQSAFFEVSKKFTGDGLKSDFIIFSSLIFFCVFSAYLFHLVFERPFMKNYSPAKAKS